MPWWDESEDEKIPHRVATTDEEDEEIESLEDEMPTEKTKLLGFWSSKASNKATSHGSLSDDDDENDVEAANEDGDDDQKEYQYHSDIALMPESMAYKVYLWFSGIAATIALSMLLIQLVAFATLGGDDTGKFFSETMIRTFVVGFCALFFFVEIPITSRLAGRVLGMTNWVNRGILWCFVAVVCAESGQASLFANFPQIPGFPEHVTVLVTKMVAALMFLIGSIYVILGSLCLKYVMDRVIGHYEEHVANRIHTAESDMQQELQEEEQEPEDEDDEEEDEEAQMGETVPDESDDSDDGNKE